MRSSQVDLHTFVAAISTLHWELAGFGDFDGLLWLVAVALWNVLDGLDDLVALKDLAENDVLAVQPAMVMLVVQLIWDDIERTYLVTAVVMKNWEPLVSLPELAMERRPFLVWRSLKFSSANLLP